MLCGPRHSDRVGQPLTAIPAAMHAKGDDSQDYAGYSVWDPDPRTPDFTNW